MRAWFMTYRRPAEDTIEYNLDFWTSKEVPLYADDAPTWLVHPTYSDVDIGCVPMPTLGGLFPEIQLDKEPAERDPADGTPITVIGFPAGEPSVARLPQMTPGTFVKSFIPGHPVRPRVLIDADTSPGSSGSLVVRPTGYMSEVSRLGPKFTVPEQRIVGIYSGRFRGRLAATHPARFAHGQVWRLRAVADIIAGGVRAAPNI